MRQYRTEAVALHAAGQPIPPELALKVKSAQGRLSEFCKTNGLTERLARTQVTGYNKSVGAAVRKIATHEEKFREFHKNVIISSPHHQNSGKLKEYVQSIGRKQGHLSEADQKLLDALPRRYMWVQVKPEEANVYSLAALTARTGDEYAMFAKGDVKIIVRGRPDAGWHLPKDLSRRVFDEHLKWTAHSHPTTVNIQASQEDRDTLAQFTWQQNSLVIDLTGNTQKFTPNLFDDLFKGGSK